MCETQRLPTAFLVTSDRIGPDEDLGDVLTRSFWGTVAQSEQPPDRVLFLNRAALLTVEGSEVLEPLLELEAAGVEIFSCGTCLQYYDKKEALRVGRIGTMYDTVETLTGPWQVSTIR